MKRIPDCDHLAHVQIDLGEALIGDVGSSEEAYKLFDRIKSLQIIDLITEQAVWSIKRGEDVVRHAEIPDYMREAWVKYMDFSD